MWAGRGAAGRLQPPPLELQPGGPRRLQTRCAPLVSLNPLECWVTPETRGSLGWGWGWGQWPVHASQGSRLSGWCRPAPATPTGGLQLPPPEKTKLRGLRDAGATRRPGSRPPGEGRVWTSVLCGTGTRQPGDPRLKPLPAWAAGMLALHAVRSGLRKPHVPWDAW